jgi:hypothetical protein
MFDLVSFKQVFDKTREFLIKNDKEFKNNLIRYKTQLDLITNEYDFNAKTNEINHKIEKEIAIKGMLLDRQKLENFQSSLTSILKCSICLEKLKFPVQVTKQKN